MAVEVCSQSTSLSLLGSILSLLTSFTPLSVSHLPHPTSFFAGILQIATTAPVSFSDMGQVQGSYLSVIVTSHLVLFSPSSSLLLAGVAQSPCMQKKRPTMVNARKTK